MKLKVMLTGRNQRIAANISEHLEADRGYEVVKCIPKKNEIADMLEEEVPHIVVCCLSNETWESVRAYEALLECGFINMLYVIVVANDEDLREFKRRISLRRSYFLPRPISIVEFYALLRRIEDELVLKEEKEQPEPPLPEEPSGEEVEEEEEPSPRKRILIVDDDPEQLAQIKGNLKDFYDVTAVRSGPAALDYLESHAIDLMLLDYIMPEMDGPEVLYRLKTTRAYAQIPVIFLTGVTEREKVVKTLVELRPQGYLIKPAKKSEIIAKIIDVLE